MSTRRFAWVFFVAACSSSGSVVEEPAPLPGRDAGGEEAGNANCSAPSGTCDGECVDLAVDARHCGACGHSCLGGICEVGRCVATTIANGLATPTAIRIQGTNAYVLRTGGVDRVALTGGPPTPLFTSAPGSPFDVTAGPHALALDANYAYFLMRQNTTRYVTRCALGGCFASPQILVAVTVLNPFAVEADATTIAWSATYQDIRQCSAASCTTSTTLIPSQEGKVQFAMLASEVVWSNEFNNAVYRCPRVGCTVPTELAGANALGGSPGPISIHDGDAYFASRGSVGVTYAIHRCAVAGCAGAPTLIAQGDGVPGAIAADASGVYWTLQGSATNPTGTVLACVGRKQCGMFPTILAQARPSPLGIATTANAVYWVESRANGAIGWVAKSLD